MKLLVGDRVQLDGKKWKAKFRLEKSGTQNWEGLIAYDAKEEKGDTSFIVLSDGTTPYTDLKVRQICRTYGVLDHGKAIIDALG